jgi:hypothetical protein
MSKRWGLKHEDREFIVHQETREDAVSLFARGLGEETFRLTAPPPIEDIETGVYELGLHEGDGRVLVDNNPARETRQAHVEPAAALPLAAVAEVVKTLTNGASENSTLHGPLASMVGGAALERMKNRAKGDT